MHKECYFCCEYKCVRTWTGRLGIRLGTIVIFGEGTRDTGLERYTKGVIIYELYFISQFLAPNRYIESTY